MQLLLLITLFAAYDVRSFGASGDGKSNDTVSIQATIDAAWKAGGGTVQFPAGRYLSGTIHLKSNITLRLDSGATIAASPVQADFDPYEPLKYNSFADKETSYSHYALIAADGAHDIAVEGHGTIDGNRTRRGGPKPVAFKNCEQVTVRDVTIRNGPNYCISLLGCDYAVIDGVRILNAYADGIDPDCSRYVRISNCFVDSSDDAICLKTSLALGIRRSTEHVTVTNCILSSSSNNFKMGTESSGDFKNIAVSNCAMFRREHTNDSSGIAIESVDGANIEGVVIANITMQGVYNPLFIRLGNRGRGLNPKVPGTLKHVTINNVSATGATLTVSVTGLPGHPVEDVHLDGMRLTFVGSETKTGSLNVPEHPEKYPECNMFGILPAYGVYVRHAKDVSLAHCRIGLINSDVRVAMICDDLVGLEVGGLELPSVKPMAVAIWLNGVFGERLQGVHGVIRRSGFSLKRQ